MADYGYSNHAGFINFNVDSCVDVPEIEDSSVRFVVDEDGLTEAEQLIADLLWEKYVDQNGNPVLDCQDDPRTVAHLLKPILARVWDDAISVANSKSFDSADFGFGLWYAGTNNPYSDD